MPLHPRPARLARRRRPLSAVRPLESLERRDLLAVVAPPEVAAKFAGHNGMAHVQHPSASTAKAAVAPVGHAPHHASTAHQSAAVSHPATANPRRLLAGLHVIPHKVSQFAPVIDPDGGDGGDGGDGNDGGIAPLATTYTPIIGAYTPTQVRTAYGAGALPLANQGQGMTIGIVDEYDDPNILGDSNAFSSYYNLPQFNTGSGPTLKVYKDTTFGSVPTSPGNNRGTAGETSLDVEWAHALAPQANILLVEVPATGSNANAFAELLHGVQYAAGQGAAVVSLSYGYPETGTPSIGASNVAALDNAYLASGAATSTVVTVSSGDSTYPGYPATSPNVVAVGGSSLYLASAKGRYSYETAWGGVNGAGAGGGGQSMVFASPTYQSTHGVTYSNRAVPDVALIADPITGVSVYDSFDTTTRNPDPWTEFGGTSLASPVFAGIVTLAQQSRSNVGKPFLTSSQLDDQMYSLYNSPLYSTYFHDINQGNNNDVGSGFTYYNATNGYDLATGIGSPNASTLVPLLATL